MNDLKTIDENLLRLSEKSLLQELTLVIQNTTVLTAIIY